MMNHFFLRHMKCRAVMIIAVLQIVFFIFCAVYVIHHVSVRSAMEGEKKEECYMSIRVHAGESLWEISKRYYSSEYRDMKQYIRKIKYLNHMTDENVNAGSYLIIPYYD